METKRKKIVWLLLCILIISMFSTGCGVAQESKIKVVSSTKADFSMSIGLDDEALEEYASLLDISCKEFISRMKENGSAYSTRTISGVKYNMFTDTQKGMKLSEVEDVLEELGYDKVCVTKDFFYARYIAQKGSLEDMLVDDSGLTQKQIKQLENMKYIQIFSIQLNNRIKSTNGKIDRSNTKLVKWTYASSDKSKTFFATTSPSKTTAMTRSVQNNKSYKTSVKIAVQHSFNLVKMTLDGKSIKNGSVVKQKGRHELVIWSKDGKCQVVKFTIK